MKLRSWNLKTVISLMLLLSVIMWALPNQAPVYAADETVSFGVEGYTEGSDWNISSSKSLLIEANGLDSKSGGYRIRITLAKGMKPGSFIWDNTDTTKWPKSAEVQGSSLDMGGAALDFFAGGSATVDSNGNTVIEYIISEGVSRINLTDKVVVSPDGNFVYINDTIEDAITIELLNKDGNLIAGKSKTIDVKTVGDKITNYSYTAKKLMAGQENVHLYDAHYGRRWTGTYVAPLPVGTVNITLGIPACVSEITEVKVKKGNTVESVDPASLSYDVTSHTLTVTGCEIGKGEDITLSLYGSISQTATPKNYNAAIEQTRFEYTSLYDGEAVPPVTYEYPTNMTSLSGYSVMVVDSQDTIRIVDNLANNVFSQFPEGHYAPLGRTRGFFTANAQNEDQIATWTFDTSKLNVIGVYFPTDTGRATITSVTLSNNVTYQVNQEIDGGSQKIAYVNVADLHELNNDIPKDLFIKSITANCGTFPEGFSSNSWYGKPIGRFNPAIESGAAQTIPYTFSVNGTYSETMEVIYDPSMEVACINIEDKSYSDSDRTIETTGYKAGTTVYMSTKLSIGGNTLVPTKEPKLYVVVPKDVYFDPTLVTAHDWITTTNSNHQEETPNVFSVADGSIVYSMGYVQGTDGDYYTCYEFSVPNSLLSAFQNVEKSRYGGRGHTWYGSRAISLFFDYHFDISETANTKDINIGDYLMGGKGDIHTGKFTTISGANNTSSHVDEWDLNGNDNRTETDVITASSKTITILDNMNITVSGYLTHGGSSSAVNPYNPGADGSNEVHVVEFLPNTNADYHVVISNTLVSIGEKCAVNAYIPIPKGTIDGTNFTSQNITPGPQGGSRLYQFNDFQWPMTLRNQIENVDPNNFEILYYLDNVTIDENGKPSGNTTMNPNAEELERTVLVEIRSKENIKVPSGQFEFTLPLKVGVTETEATAAGRNLTKNIFRPRYYREGGIGDLWVNGNYVAARLAVSSIGGYVFYDFNGNGIWDTSDAMEGPLSGVVSVELYDEDNNLLATKTPDESGKYSFTGADISTGKIDAGTYTVKFVNNQSTSGYVFTKNQAPTQQNYRINSEAIGSSDNTYAEATITLPYNGVLSGYQEFINAGLYIDLMGGDDDGYSPDGIPDGCEARVDYVVENGTASKTFDVFYEEDGDGGYKHTNDLTIDIEPPIVTPTAGYEMDRWENSVDPTQNPSSDGRFHFDSAGDPGTPITVTAYCKQMEGTYTVTYDANGKDATVPAPQVKQAGIPLVVSPGEHVMNSASIGPTPVYDYMFICWNTKADGSGTTYYAGDMYSTDADITLYAQYIPYNPAGDIRYDVYHFYRYPDDSYEMKLERYGGILGERIDVREMIRLRDGFVLSQFEAKECDPEEPFILKQNGQQYHFIYAYEEYTITFDTNGGSTIESITARPGTAITAPDDPTKEGYIFSGWDKQIPETMPNEDMTITANWEEAPPEYTVTFLDYDGTELSKVKGPEGKTVSAPAVTSNRTGYRVTGWDADVPNTIPDYDMTITAVYEPIEYTIRYTLNGGTVQGNPSKYTIESGAITLNNPTKPGYSFAGWSGTDIAGQSTEVTIPSGSTGNKEFTANWPESATYKVEHYQANIDGSFPNYPTETEVRSGTIGEMSGAVEKSYTGFTLHEPIVQQTINDSTDPEDMTVVKVYYDRKIYTFNWYDEGEDGGDLLYTTTAVYGAEIPDYGGEQPQKASTAELTYTFDKWVSEPNEVSATVSENVNYTATYTSETRKYNVTFVDEDGTTILKEATPYDYGTAAADIIKPDDPTKEGNAQYTYTFSGWEPEVADVNGDAIYKAKYNATLNQYTIKFVNDDGTELQSSQVDYGTVPEYNGATPTKSADAQYTYTFAGWDTEPVAVTGDATYTARFSSTVNKYTVTWKNDDGTELEKDENVPYGTTPTYDGATPTRERSAQYTYTFSGWEPEISTVTGNVTYIAKFTETKNKYTIKFMDESGETILQSSEYEYGETPSYTGETPAKEGDAEHSYAFAGWTPAITEVTGEATYKATFTGSTNQYTVTWTNYDGTVLETDENVPYGTTPTYDGTTPTREGNAQYTYTFNGWTPVISAVTGNVTYTAKFTETKNKYTIKFMDESGETVLQSSEYEYGETPSYTGETPTKEGDAEHSYTFAGWDPAITAVTGEATYKATFTESTNQYTVTWNNYDGTELEKDENVPYGTTPSYEGATPTRERTAQYTYTFDKWTPEISAVTGNVTYTASYTSEVNKYTVTWKNADGTELEKDENVPYGETPTYNGDAPTKPEDVQNTYAFAGWDPAVSSVTSDVTYIAQYTPTVKSYTITWNNYDGTKLSSVDAAYGSLIPTYTGETPTKPQTEEFVYSFDGWTPDISPVGETVTGNVTFTAAFTESKRPYSIKFVNYDGTELQSVDVEYGEMPSYTAETPTKEPTVSTRFTFAGWNPDLASVVGEATYTALFTEEARTYTVKWLDDNGEELAKVVTTYDAEVPAYPNSSLPTKEATEEYTYEFSEWQSDVEVKEKVEGDIVYMAVYIEVPKPIEYFYTQGEDSSWTQEDGKGANFRVSRNINDALTIELFERIEVDGEVVDASNYIAESGSVKLALKAEYIDSLAIGEHKLKAVFTDGAAETTFTVVRPSSDPGEEPGTEPSDEPGEEPGTDPGTDQGEDPGTNPGTDPGTNSGTDPGEDPGTNPGTDQGEDPGIDPGEDPGTNPGTDPGAKPGTNPGTNPGTDPGTNPGTDPGTNPGTDPGTNSGTTNPSKGAVPTGDESNLILWITLALTAGLAAVHIRKRYKD